MSQRKRKAPSKRTPAQQALLERAAAYADDPKFGEWIAILQGCVGLNSVRQALEPIREVLWPNHIIRWDYGAANDYLINCYSDCPPYLLFKAEKAMALIRNYLDYLASADGDGATHPYRHLAESASIAYATNLLARQLVTFDRGFGNDSDYRLPVPGIARVDAYSSAALMRSLLTTMGLGQVELMYEPNSLEQNWSGLSLHGTLYPHRRARELADELIETCRVFTADSGAGIVVLPCSSAITRRNRLTLELELYARAAVEENPKTMDELENRFDREWSTFVVKPRTGRVRDGIVQDWHFPAVIVLGQARGYTDAQIAELWVSLEHGPDSDTWPGSAVDTARRYVYRHLKNLRKDGYELPSFRRRS